MPKAVKARKPSRQKPPVIRLNAEESRRLIDALLAPPRPPTAAMKRAMKQYRETVISDVNPNSAALVAKLVSARRLERVMNFFVDKAVLFPYDQAIRLGWH